MVILFDYRFWVESIARVERARKTSLILSAIISSACLLLLSGCRWEVGTSSSATPTPSPTASPTATPTNTVTAATIVEEVEEAEDTDQASSLSAEVATAAADYFTAATDEAAESAAAVDSSISEAKGSSESLADGVSRARASLAVAREAYRKSEAAVFFVDPDSQDELRAQPDPFGAGSPTVENKAIEQLEAALTKLENLLDGSIDASTADALLVEAKTVAVELESLEKGLREMASAWQLRDAGNFRTKYFLQSPEGAVARLFQGLLAMTGDLLPADLASGVADASGDTAARVEAVREIYLGTAGDDATDVSLHALVQQTSPVQAALTRASIARAAALASVLELSPENESVAAQLSPALQDVTRQLTAAAETLGIVVVTSE